MRKFSLAAASLLLVLFASSAFAAGYGAAGCGWGGAVIEKRDFWPQLGAWILNGVSTNQTWAISTGTSNCNPKGLSAEEKEEKAFVENNFQSLVKQMAVGQGEDLRALAGMLGCSVEVSGSFASFTQKNFTSIYKDQETTPTEMLDALKRGLSGDPLLASSCNRI